MPDYVIYRRGVIEQTLIVRNADSKAHAIRKAQHIGSFDQNADHPEVETAHWEIERWHSPKTWLVEEETADNREGEK